MLYFLIHDHFLSVFEEQLHVRPVNQGDFGHPKKKISSLLNNLLPPKFSKNIFTFIRSNRPCCIKKFVLNANQKNQTQIHNARFWLVKNQVAFDYSDLRSNANIMQRGLYQHYRKAIIWFYIVSYVFHVLFWMTLKSLNVEVVKLSGICGKGTIKSQIHRFNNKWGCLGFKKNLHLVRNKSQKLSFWILEAVLFWKTMSTCQKSPQRAGCLWPRFNRKYFRM